ncbi:hypothetical protein TWF694_003359 [Orbilia ellipsospora]|uniref:Apple domain-containing protein n=1 Tax=Orbilia ellipsospora TaxID=2528407 RepID=A0AAV9WXS6_9PEZI
MDNCARAVTGTRYNADTQAIHTADCSSFMITTIILPPPTATGYVPTTVYSVITGSGAKNRKRNADDSLNNLRAPAIVKARQATQVPSNVPTYASACSGTARYSSACSCAGITAAVTTVTPPPRFVVVTTTTTVGVCDPNDSYGIKYQGGTVENTVQVSETSSDMTEQACCAACFSNNSGCFSYRFTDNTCYITTETSASVHHSPDGYCPLGQFRIAGPGSGTYYGRGPCAYFT